MRSRTLHHALLILASFHTVSYAFQDRASYGRALSDFLFPRNTTSTPQYPSKTCNKRLIAVVVAAGKNALPVAATTSSSTKSATSTSKATAAPQPKPGKHPRQPIAPAPGGVQFTRNGDPVLVTRSSGQPGIYTPEMADDGAVFIASKDEIFAVRITEGQLDPQQVKYIITPTEMAQKQVAKLLSFFSEHRTAPANQYVVIVNTPNRESDGQDLDPFRQAILRAITDEALMTRTQAMTYDSKGMARLIAAGGEKAARARIDAVFQPEGEMPWMYHFLRDCGQFSSPGWRGSTQAGPNAG